MFINEEEINFKDFQSMCRTCLKNNNLKSIKNNFLIEVLHNITDINYRIDEELPQNICDECIKKIHEIQAFAFQCIEIDLTLRKCRDAVEKSTEADITQENIKQEAESDTIQYNEIQDLNFDENVIDIDDQSKCNGVTSRPSEYIIGYISSGNFDEWFQKSTDINYSFEKFDKIESDDESDESTNLNIIENDELDKPKKKRLKREENAQPDDLQCKICMKCYKTKRAIKRHRELFKEHHYCCEVCQQICTNLSGLKKHQKMHKLSGTFLCEICNKYFYKRRSLRDHKRNVHQIN